ncbi:MAG: hypothetical protein IPK67_07350 [Planctomycetes bacterium]|nr:hypothetical protein [Planctomycetota bacterium]
MIALGIASLLLLGDGRLASMETPEPVHTTPDQSPSLQVADTGSDAEAKAAPRQAVELPRDGELPKAKVRTPKKARGTENRIVLQNPEYYLASDQFNPDGKSPTAGQMQALKALVESEALAAKAAEAKFFQVLDRCMDQKLKDGAYASIPLRPIDEYSGSYISNLSGKGPDGRPYSHNIEVRLGEFSELDVSHADRLGALAAAEAAVGALIREW